MQIELKRIQREVGITFVYVTHDQGEALTMSDRVAVMNGGHIEQLGPPKEIYERPATRFTAGFIGTSNIIEGTVDRMDGDLAVLKMPGEGRVMVPLGSSAVGERIELTVRPEKITLCVEPPATGCALPGTITEVVYLGTSTNFTVTASDGTEIVVFVQNATSSDTDIDRGDRVWLHWPPEHGYALGGSGNPS
jgi:spermidine/putrescine transport system ATP-binding protein